VPSGSGGKEIVARSWPWTDEPQGDPGKPAPSAHRQESPFWDDGAAKSRSSVVRSAFLLQQQVPPHSAPQAHPQATEGDSMVRAKTLGTIDTAMVTIMPSAALLTRRMKQSSPKRPRDPNRSWGNVIAVSSVGSRLGLKEPRRLRGWNRFFASRLACRADGDDE
jgi:hypothetical protein